MRRDGSIGRPVLRLLPIESSAGLWPFASGLERFASKALNGSDVFLRSFFDRLYSSFCFTILPWAAHYVLEVALPRKLLDVSTAAPLSDISVLGTPFHERKKKCF